MNVAWVNPVDGSFDPLGPHGAPRKFLLRKCVTAVLDLFSSVWLGIVLLILLFVYCSIGSAVPAVRESPGLELTEFEWFHWWPFNLLMLLLAITLALVTVRRIPLRMVNAGVWMIHTGILILLAGSYYYFGTKIEGDTPVIRRQVRIELPGLQQPLSLPSLPGSARHIVTDQGTWQFEIQSTHSNWPILSEPDQGQEAYAVNVGIAPPSGERFVRQLLAGYPQYTEDVLPGKGRAVKVTGRKLVNEDVRLSLDYEPQESFHVMKSWALFVRKAGESEWMERPMPGMPRYHDRISSREQVYFDPNEPPPLRPLDLEVPRGDIPDALSGASVRVTAFLRYADLQRRWRDGGPTLNPVLAIGARTAHAEYRRYELAAFVPEESAVENGAVRFLWLDDSAKVRELPNDSRALLRMTVPQTSATLDVPLTADNVLGREGPWVPIDGTEFSYRVLHVMDDLSLPGGRRPVSVAMVEIQTAESTFTRMVADQAETTRDIHGDDDPHNPLARRTQTVDPRIQMSYHPRSAPVTFAAYPGGIFLAVNGAQGRVFGREIAIGEDIEVIPGLNLRAEALWLHGVQESKPYVVPRRSRDRGMEEHRSLIQLEVATARGGVQSRWLHFNQYALPSNDYAYPGRLHYMPERFQLDDGTIVEVLFSRRRAPLPAPIVMEDFELDTHIGGYSGSATTIRNYISRLRFGESNQRTEPRPTSVNNPTEFGGYWYFQSMWDRPLQDNPTGGMNYTVLGVGNRKGVYVQLAGCSLAVAGMFFAFYVKPVIQRNRRDRALAKVSAGRSNAQEDLETEVFMGTTP